MDKQEFLKQLEEELKANSVSEKKSAKYLTKFEKIIDEAPEEEREKVIENLGSPSELAAKIKSINDKREETKKISTGEPKVKSIKAEPIDDEQDTAAPPMSEKGKRVFLIGAIATAPINLVLCLIIAASFIAAYAAVLLFSGFLILAEIAGVILGVLLGVGGILYGIVGLLPGEIPAFVGQYELGFGIMLIGIVTVAGILIYEYVMKVTPLGIKGVTWLFKLTVRKIIQLVLFIKKECGKL